MRIKMLGIFKAYCPYSLINKVFEEDKHLRKILSEHCILVLDIEGDEFRKAITENFFVKKLTKRDNMDVLSDEDSFNYIRAKQLDDYLNAIIITEDPKQAEEIRSSYGILALSINDPYTANNTPSVGFEFNPKDDSCNPNWSDALNQTPLYPINTIIINDYFLWSKMHEVKSCNSGNILPILKALTADSRCKHVSILLAIYKRDSALTSAKAGIIIDEIKDQLSNDTGKSVSIGMFTHSSKLLHKRVILTNYHYINSDNGFFVIKNGNVATVTDGKRDWLFNDILTAKGKTHRDWYKRTLQMISNEIQDCKKKENTTKFTVGQIANPILQ